MTTTVQNLKWNLYCDKRELLYSWGLKTGLIKPYDDELIEKLRKVYYGGIPASITLLSNSFTQGKSYDCALLMARAFLESDDDVKLVYATIDGIKLNPKHISSDSSYADHCVVERTTKDGKSLIYDTSVGLVFDKRLYWLMEHPKVRKVNNKESIKKYIEDDEDFHPEDIERDKYIAPLFLPNIEMTLQRPNEFYSQEGVGLLQREIEYYKNLIGYDDLVKEVDEDMRRLGLRR